LAAEVRQIAELGGPALCGSHRVVDVAGVESASAPGEPAALITCPQQTPEIFGWAVAIHGEHQAADGVGEHPLPCEGAAGEPAGGLAVDGTVAGELRGIAERCIVAGVVSDEGEYRHR